MKADSSNDFASRSSQLANIEECSRDSEDEIEQDSDVIFPDGGWRAWSVVFGSWCAMVPSFGLMNTIGVFEAWLAENQLRDYSKASIGWIFSLYMFFLYFGSIQVGKKLVHSICWDLSTDIWDFRTSI